MSAFWENEKNILIRVDNGTSQAELVSNSNIYERQIIHVYIAVNNVQNTFQANKQYLETVVGKFFDWLLAKAYTDVEFFARHYRSPLEVDLWLICYDVI